MNYYMRLGSHKRGCCDTINGSIYGIWSDMCWYIIKGPNCHFLVVVADLRGSLRIAHPSHLLLTKYTILLIDQRSTDYMFIFVVVLAVVL